MSALGITLCLLVRDNEEEVRGPLQPVLRFFENILVLDTGSRDQTTPLLRAAGASVFHTRFVPDFSMLRNQLLDRVETPWVLYLDSDEIIRTDELALLTQIIQSAPDDVWGYHLPTAYYKDPQASLSYMTPALDGRLDPDLPGAEIHDRLVCFRALNQIRYRGLVHESVYKSIIESGKKAEYMPVLIHNYGYPSSWNIKKNRVSVQKSELYENLLKQQLRRSPFEVKPLYELGIVHMEKKSWPKARSCFRRAVKLKLNFFEAWFFWGLMEKEMDNPLAALTAFQVAIQDLRWGAHAAYHCGIIYQSQGKFRDAYLAYKEAWRRSPNKTPVFWSIVRLLQFENLHKLVLSWFKNRSANVPTDLNYFYYRAVSHAQCQEVDDGIYYFKKALAENPNHVPSLMNLAILYASVNRYDTALDLFKKVIHLEPHHPHAKEYLTRCRQQRSSIHFTGKQSVSSGVTL